MYVTVEMPFCMSLGLNKRSSDTGLQSLQTKGIKCSSMGILHSSPFHFRQDELLQSFVSDTDISLLQSWAGRYSLHLVRLRLH